MAKKHLGSYAAIRQILPFSRQPFTSRDAQHVLPPQRLARRSVLASPHETLWRRSRAFPVSFLVLFASGFVHPVIDSDPDRQRDVALEAQASKPLKLSQRTLYGEAQLKG